MKLFTMPSARTPRTLLFPALLLQALILASAPASADVLVGRVVGVTDGDTVTVLDDAKTEHKIRVAGIDAPEKSMPWGHQAKQAMSDHVFGRDVRVDWNKRDRYGRIVGKVLVNNQDAGLSLVNGGLAWHYKKYENEQSPSDRVTYAQQESEARLMKRGIWSDPAPIPPWEWRKR